MPLEQLTERGMEQMEAVGDHIRQVFVEDKLPLSVIQRSGRRTPLRRLFPS